MPVEMTVTRERISLSRGPGVEHPCDAGDAEFTITFPRDQIAIPRMPVRVRGRLSGHSDP